MKYGGHHMATEINEDGSGFWQNLAGGVTAVVLKWRIWFCSLNCDAGQTAEQHCSTGGSVDCHRGR